MSLLGRITTGLVTNPGNTQERAGVQVEVSSAHPTPEQVADALLAKLQLSQTDRAALKEAHGGRDIRDQLIAELRRRGINSAALTYVGAGKYRGYVGLPTETRQRLIAWSRTDGQAPAATSTGMSAKQQELQAQGALARHRAELALRQQEARQQIVAGVVGMGGVQMAGAAAARGLPKAAPLLAEALPPLALGTGLVASMAVTLDKGLEQGVEHQMEAIRNAPPMMSKEQDEGPPVDTAQQKPSAPAVPSEDELPKGKLVPAGKAAPPATTTPKEKDEPSGTQPTAPQDEPPSGLPLGKLVGPAISAATTAAGIGAEKMAGANTNHIDLTAHEAKGGHLIAKHVNQTDTQLAQRLVDEPNIPAATTWTDLTTAEKVVTDAITTNQAKIQQWLAAGKPKTLVLPVSGDPASPVGHGIVRGDAASRPMHDAIIVLKRDDAGSWFVLTGYPKP